MKIIDRLRRTRPKTRRYIYRVVGASLSLGAVYGVLSGEEAAAILLVASAALGLADANVEA